MWGQTCVAQLSKASLASTLGAKAGTAITEAPRSVNITRAEKELSIVGLLTLFGFDPSALGDSHCQQPDQVKGSR